MAWIMTSRSRNLPFPRPARLLLLGLFTPGCWANATDPIDVEAACNSGGLIQPVTLPSTPSFSINDFMGADYCGSCHPNHYEQWQDSAHGHAMTDPVFQALVRTMQSELGPETMGQERFCTQCHSPIGTRSCDVTPQFEFAQLSPATLEGVSCETCHRIDDIDPETQRPFIDVMGALRAPEPAEHQLAPHQVTASPLHRDPQLCASCHDVDGVDGLTLERPYGEWLESPAQPNVRTCQDCHMPARSGPRASHPDADPTATVHGHRFVGIDTLLYVDPDAPTYLSAAQEMYALLAEAGRIELRAVPTDRFDGRLRFDIEVHNLIEGHNLPTGSTFFRQLWVHWKLVDAQGQTRFESGAVNAEGDIVQSPFPFAPATIMLTGRLMDAQGDITFLPWRAAGWAYDHSIAPLGRHTERITLPLPPFIPEQIQIQARLLFRPYAPHFLRQLGLDEMAQNLPIITLDETQITVYRETP